MATVNKRLDDLEGSTGSKLPLKVIYARDDLPGYFERNPFGKDAGGQKYNESEKELLAAEFDLTLIVYIRDWRSSES